MRTTEPAIEPPARLPWPPILMATTVGLGLGLGKIAGVRFHDAFDTPALRAVGVILIAAALTIDIWCGRALARRDTTILPHRAATNLVTEGPYVYSRHPIYIAHTALTLGLGLSLAAPFIVALVPLLAAGLQKLSIEPEERHLQSKFGEDYRAYMARTPRWL
jgi:protein-S-isoprenylcysteine O-methyltransferase Ste14